MLVAARFLKRWRVTKPHGRAAGYTVAPSASARGAAGDPASGRGSHSGRGANGKRGRLRCFRVLRSGSSSEHREVKVLCIFDFEPKHEAGAPTNTALARGSQALEPSPMR